MPFPYGARPLRIFFAASIPGSGGEAAGFSITAAEKSAGGNGVMISVMESETREEVGFTVHPTSAPILNTGQQLVTAAARSNYEPGSDPLTTVFLGYSDAIVATPPQFWIFHGISSNLLGAAGGGRGEIFIPAGRTATFLSDAVNKAVDISVSVDEL